MNSLVLESMEKHRVACVSKKVAIKYASGCEKQSHILYKVHGVSAAFRNKPCLTCCNALNAHIEDIEVYTTLCNLMDVTDARIRVANNLGSCVRFYDRCNFVSTFI